MTEEPEAVTDPSVVVVDDEPDVVSLLQMILKRKGFEVVGTAADGETGIEVVADKQPDVVLLDITMPRLDGEAALPEIIKVAPETMVAILSAHLDVNRAERVLLAGAFAAYDKSDLGRLPVILSEDLASFRRVLDGEDNVAAWQRRYRRL